MNTELLLGGVILVVIGTGFVAGAAFIVARTVASCGRLSRRQERSAMTGAIV